MSARLITICLSATVLGTAEDEILPVAFPVTRYTEIWEDSPFNREVVKVVEQKVISSFGQSIALEGLVSDDAVGPIAYVRDVKEDKPLVVTSQASESHPYTIVSANQVNNPFETTVTITDGTETAEIGYAENRLTQKIEQAPPARKQKGPEAPAGRSPNAPPEAPPNAPSDAAPAVSRNPSQRAPAQTNGETSPPAAAAAPALDRLEADDDRLEADDARRRVPLPNR
ncbi:MAG: hypothetical protein WD342_20930 [Verrucomicrobiales bacterium]